MTISEIVIIIIPFQNAAMKWRVQSSTICVGRTGLIRMSPVLSQQNFWWDSKSYPYNTLQHRHRVASDSTILTQHTTVADGQTKMSKKCRPVYGPQCTHTHTHIGLMGHLPCQPEQARYPLNFHSPLPSRLCVLSVQTNSSDILFDIIPPPCLPVCGIYGRRRLLCFVNLSPKLTLPDVVSVTQLLPPGTHFLEQYSKASQ